LCLSSRVLKSGDYFDDSTGDLILQNDGIPSPGPEGKFEEMFFASGHVAGAKPGQNCIPTKDTPPTELAGNPYLWVNLRDATTANELNDLSRIYRWTGKDDTLKAYAQMMEGVDYCPLLLVPDDDPTNRFCLEGMTFNESLLCDDAPKNPNAPSSQCASLTVRECDAKKLAAFRMAQTRKCAETYIAMRSMQPWVNYERYGTAWQEFLAPPGPPHFGYGGNEDEPPVRMLQPLIRGDQARLVYKGKMRQRDAEKASTIRDGKHPWRNEWEYELWRYLESSAKITLYYGSSLDKAAGAKLPANLAMRIPDPFPKSDLPCLQDEGPGGTNPQPIPPAPAPAPAPAPQPAPDPEPPIPGAGAGGIG
jgi:hypothetical protein